MQKLATQIKQVNDFGFQLILTEPGVIAGVNLLYGQKILIKKRFDKEIQVKNQNEENDIVFQVIKDCIKMY